MIVFSFLLLISIILDISAIIHLHFSNDIPSAIVLHGCAIITTILGFYCIKSYYQHFRNMILVLLFLFALLMPLLGVIGCIAIARMLYLTQKRYQRIPVQQLKIEDKELGLPNKYGVGGLHFIIKSNEVPVAARISAFKSLSNISPEKTNSLVRSMLPDKQEEIRLLAFYLLNKQETKIVNEISHSLELLEKTNNPNFKAKLHKWLANHYWELIYKKLVDPSLIKHVTNQSLHYALLARNDFPDDPSILLLLGRIYLEEHQLEKAIELFKQAIKFDGLVDRIGPYIAQAYFYQHNFYEIKKYTQPVSSVFITQVSRQLADFWSVRNG